jgi:hypothetical protein
MNFVSPGGNMIEGRQHCEVISEIIWYVINSLLSIDVSHLWFENSHLPLGKHMPQELPGENPLA